MKEMTLARAGKGSLFRREPVISRRLCEAATAQVRRAVRRSRPCCPMGALLRELEPPWVKRLAS